MMLNAASVLIAYIKIVITIPDHARLAFATRFAVSHETMESFRLLCFLSCCLFVNAPSGKPPVSAHFPSTLQPSN